MTDRGNGRGAVIKRRFRARSARKDIGPKETWKWVFEMVIIGGIGIGTLVLGFRTLDLGITQLEAVNDGLSSSAAAAVYQQQQDIDDLFVEHPELDPYFSKKVAVPPSPPVLTPNATPEETTAFEEAVAKKAKVEAVAFRILDHMEHVRYQVDNGLFESSYAAWEDYFRSSFESSPAMCEMLLQHNAEYDGLGEGSLWEEFAAPPCIELGIKF